MMKLVEEYVDGVKDEAESAMDYAEHYLVYKSGLPQVSVIYADMAKQEIGHCENLINIGEQMISKIAYVPEDDKDTWMKTKKHALEKVNVVRFMLSK